VNEVGAVVEPVDEIEVGLAGEDVEPRELVAAVLGAGAGDS